MYQELLKVKGDSLCLTDKNITNISDGWALPPSYLDFAQELGFGRLSIPLCHSLYVEALNVLSASKQRSVR